MKQFGNRCGRAVLGGALALAAVGILAGCQLGAARAPQPTPTSILLAPEVTAASAVAAPGGTASPATRFPVAEASATQPVAVAQPTITPAGSLMALGTHPTVVLRVQPAADATVVAQVPGSQVLWATGRSGDGKWLWVTYSDSGRHAWIAAADVKLMGDTSALIAVTAGGEPAPTVVPTAAAVPVATVPAVAAAPPVPTPTAASTTAPRRTPAPAPRLPGKIAFQTANGDGIYLVNADGTGLRRVTEGMDPALSPDGTRLAFARWGVPDGVYVIDLATGQEQRIAAAQRPRWPTWRPDGSALVFSQVVRLDTCLNTPLGCVPEDIVRDYFGGQECIDTIQGRFCISDFSVSQVELTKLVLFTLATGNWQDLATQMMTQAPSWQPQGSDILYRGRTGLQLVTADSATRSFVDNVSFGNASWSPDGQRIVAQARMHDHWDIVLLDTSGKTVAHLTVQDPLATRAVDSVAPSWSSDGRSIIFLSNRDGAWRVYRMGADGSGQALFLPQVFGQFTFRYDYAAERMLHWGR